MSNTIPLLKQHLSQLKYTGFILFALSLSPSAVHAESVQIQPNDTLSGIVSENYPNLARGNLATVMQAILEKNPDAFIDNNINRLILGRTLELPPLTALQLPAQPDSPADNNTQQSTDTPDPEIQRQLESIQEERDRLINDLKQLETNNSELKGQLERLEKIRLEQNEALRQLEEQINTLEAAETPQENNTAKPEAAAPEGAQDSKKKSPPTPQSLIPAEAETTQRPDSRVQSDLKAARNQVTQLTADLQAARDQNVMLEADLQAARDQNVMLEADLQAARDQNVMLEADLQAARDQNVMLEADLQAARDQNVILETDLQAARDQNVMLEADLQAARDQNVTLETDLQAARDQNVTLETELEQIKAAASNDVRLQDTPSTTIPDSWWPWLLALLLLPVAWFIGRRSRPAPDQWLTKTALATDTDPAPAGDIATNDPVIPATLRTETGAQQTEPAQLVPDDPDTAIKLDIARAYLDLRDAEAAHEVLQEVMLEGGTRQQQEAREILSFLP